MGMNRPRILGAGVALICGISLIIAADQTVLAQAGSIGGTVGKTGKSASGGSETAKLEPVEKPRAIRPPGPPISMDGTWAGVSSGHCIPTWPWSIQISRGVISGNGTSGQISSGGAARGAMEVLGTVYNFVGHFGAREAAGTFRTAAGCTGQWTATKS
jgi:hypothetical protein